MPIVGRAKEESGIPTLLPNLGTLRNQLMGPRTGDDFSTAHLALEFLPYALGATYQALIDFIQAEHDLVLTTPTTNAQGERVISVIGSTGRDKLSYKVDTFLESARRAQNAVIPYISKALSVSLPASLDDVVKKVAGRRSTFRRRLPPILRATGPITARRSRITATSVSITRSWHQKSGSFRRPMADQRST